MLLLVTESETARPAVAPYQQKERWIARIWHGWTKRADAKAYEKLLRDEIFPSIAVREIDGYRGAELFVREDGDEVEFVTLLRFDSMNAVKEFAGRGEQAGDLSAGRGTHYENEAGAARMISVKPRNFIGAKSTSMQRGHFLIAERVLSSSCEQNSMLP